MTETQIKRSIFQSKQELQSCPWLYEPTNPPQPQLWCYEISIWKYDNCFSSKMESHHHAHHHGHHHGPPQAGGGAEGGTGTGKANGGPQHSVWVVRCNNIIICRCPSYPLYPYIITLSQVLNPVTKSRSFFCSHALGMPAKSRGTTQHI